MYNDDKPFDKPVEYLAITEKTDTPFIGIYRKPTDQDHE